MEYRRSRRTIGAALVLLAITAPVLAATGFRAAGTGTVEGIGNRREITLEGYSTQLGPWIGTLHVTVRGWDSMGNMTMIAASGDTLDIEIDVTFDPVLFKQVGSFAVTGGTGRFYSARGGGYFEGSPHVSPEGEFVDILMEGDIEF